MQICRYLPVKESCFTALLGHYTTFGLRAETETERGWLPLLTLSDVSCDEEFIRAFAQRCTECGLSPVHLTDAVLDALP